MRFFVFILILLFSCNVFSAEEFPSRPIEIVIGSPPGSSHAIMVDIINEKEATEKLIAVLIRNGKYIKQ
jgi:tripartite-type tricarboxylate transporter receptor subunit TctC